MDLEKRVSHEWSHASQIFYCFSAPRGVSPSVSVVGLSEYIGKHGPIRTYMYFVFGCMFDACSMLDVGIREVFGGSQCSEEADL